MESLAVPSSVAAGTVGKMAASQLLHHIAAKSYLGLVASFDLAAHFVAACLAVGCSLPCAAVGVAGFDSGCMDPLDGNSVVSFHAAFHLGVQAWLEQHHLAVPSEVLEYQVHPCVAVQQEE